MIRCGNLFSPLRELYLRVGTWKGFIHGTVNFPTERVHRIHGISPLAWEKEEGIIKITTTLFCRGNTVSLCFSGGHRICIKKGKNETVGGRSPYDLGSFTIPLLEVMKKAANNQFQVSRENCTSLLPCLKLGTRNLRLCHKISLFPMVYYMGKRVSALILVQEGRRLVELNEWQKCKGERLITFRKG